MFRRGILDRITHAVIFDEAHRAANLTRLPTMAKECRKYGISNRGSQEAEDFNVSLFSAIANYLVFRVTESDAKANIFPQQRFRSHMFLRVPQTVALPFPSASMIP
jgi:DNA phosphorothioation-dependent restriction protein DptH